MVEVVEDKSMKLPLPSRERAGVRGEIQKPAPFSS